MALVNCPECGKEVSSNAKQCIHCGCFFTVCPDCQTVTLGGRDACPNCGYRFSGKKGQQSETVTEDDMIGKFRLRSETERKRNRIARIIMFGLICLTVILLAVGGLLLELWWENWKNSGALEKLDIAISLKNDFNSIKLLLVFSCVCIVSLVVLTEFNEIFNILRHKASLKYKKDDISQYVKTVKELAYSEEATAVEYNECLNATYLIYQPEYSNKLILISTINVLLAFFSTIFLTVAVSQNIWEFMLTKVNENKFSFQYIWLIIGAVCLVAAVIFSKISGNKKETVIEGWEKQILDNEELKTVEN